MNHSSKNYYEWTGDKIRDRDNPLKITGTSVQGIVETQMEILGLENHSLYPFRCSMYCALTEECPSKKL